MTKISKWKVPPTRGVKGAATAVWTDYLNNRLRVRIDSSRLQQHPRSTAAGPYSLIGVGVARPISQ